MAIVNRISEHEYRELALNEEDRLWELWDGVPVEKPGMSFDHDVVSSYLAAMLISQLDRREYWVTANGGKARRSDRYYFIPDVVVIPDSYAQPLRGDPRGFNAHSGAIREGSMPTPGRSRSSSKSGHTLPPPMTMP